MSITTQSMEMFRLNGFLEGNFQTILSSFRPKEGSSSIKRMIALAGSNVTTPAHSKYTPKSSSRANRYGENSPS